MHACRGLQSTAEGVGSRTRVTEGWEGHNSCFVRRQKTGVTIVPHFLSISDLNSQQDSWSVISGPLGFPLSIFRNLYLGWIQLAIVFQVFFTAMLENTIKLETPPSMTQLQHVSFCTVHLLALSSPCGQSHLHWMSLVPSILLWFPEWQPHVISLPTALRGNDVSILPGVSFLGSERHPHCSPLSSLQVPLCLLLVSPFPDIFT